MGLSGAGRSCSKSRASTASSMAILFSAKSSSSQRKLAAPSLPGFLRRQRRAVPLAEWRYPLCDPGRRAQSAEDSRCDDRVEHTPNIRWAPRQNESSYVTFVRGSGCSSSVGMVGGAQNVNLADTCTAGQATHEMGHARAYAHQQRNDRDQYVNVFYGNLDRRRLRAITIPDFRTPTIPVRTISHPSCTTAAPPTREGPGPLCRQSRPESPSASGSGSLPRISRP